jgi:tRNA threonylcarbamoyladenosine biosynthesis protein TsaE
MKIISKSISDTEKIAEDFVKKISSGQNNTALVVGLYGDLGSGKTTFTQSIAKIFGIKEDITSPTYVIMKSYKINQNSTLNIPHSNLIHIDAYRLNSSKELLVLGFDKIVSDPRNIIFIEWPEIVKDILPENHLKINFKFIGENEREIEI